MRLVLVSSALLLAAVPVTGGEAESTVVRDYCVEEIAPEGQLCDCLLRQLAKLNDDQQALVAALVLDDAEALAAVVDALSDAEREQAETFLKHETLLCRPSG